MRTFATPDIPGRSCPLAGANLAFNSSDINRVADAGSGGELQADPISPGIRRIKVHALDLGGPRDYWRHLLLISRSP